ncbi:MAG: hypothetical protein JST48_10030 [Bacteroidetes bacterium]|nr:hypothetical protein [Bacteroidota bacterium]
MKPSAILFLSLLSILSCSKPKNNEAQEASTTDNPNQALYDRVMDIHNEVMPLMDEIYNLKNKLNEKMGRASVISESKKKELQQIIIELDSADRSMMNWMHKFNPLPGSANQEAARTYLEDEMEKIKQVKELMNSSIQKAKDEVAKND